MKPREPNENGTTGGTGPLNIEAACKMKMLTFVQITKTVTIAQIVKLNYYVKYSYTNLNICKQLNYQSS